MNDVPSSGSDRYVVISADGHAGLACEDYRPYLESRYHPAFEAVSYTHLTLPTIFRV